MLARRTRLLVGLALLVVVLVSSVFFSSAATLGGMHTDTLGSASGNTQNLSAVQLAWNPGVDDGPTRPTNLRLTASDGESFGSDDVVDVTAAGNGSEVCSARAIVAAPSATVDLVFSACAVPLWEVQGVAVSVSGSGAVTSLTSTVGALRGTLSSFDGAVVEPEGLVTPGYTTTRQGGVELLATLRLAVRDATVEQLVGRRLAAELSSGAGRPTPYAGVVGTRANNQGVWVETDPATATPVVIAELARLAGGRPPTTADVTSYRLVLLQAQRLGAGQSSATKHAVATAAGTVKPTSPDPDPTPSPTPTPADVSSALEAVGLDPRLKFTAKNTPRPDSITLRYCYDFEVRNTSKERVEWRVSFDTTKPPMWGLNPEIVQDGAAGTLHSAWGFHTVAYQSGTGLWTVGGVEYNKVLQPGQSVTVGYCARPEIPAVDTTRFEKPEVSLVPGSDKYYVQFRVKVTSSFAFPVPWEAEVDLSDHVCPASLPADLAGQNSVMTPIDGSRYRVRGTDNTYRFVSTKAKQDYVFLGFKPVSDPFAPGCK